MLFTSFIHVPHQVMQARAPNMVTCALCAPREGNFCAVTRAPLLIMSTALIRPCGEYRAETGPVKCALGQMTNGLGAAA